MNEKYYCDDCGLIEKKDVIQDLKTKKLYCEICNSEVIKYVIESKIEEKSIFKKEAEEKFEECIRSITCSVSSTVETTKWNNVKPFFSITGESNQKVNSKELTKYLWYRSFGEIREQVKRIKNIKNKNNDQIDGSQEEHFYPEFYKN